MGYVFVGAVVIHFAACFSVLHRLCLTMSWLLPMWISLGFLLLCQATLYQTIQQHYVARPGRTDILTLGKSAILTGSGDNVTVVPLCNWPVASTIGCVKATAGQIHFRMSEKFATVFKGTTVYSITLQLNAIVQVIDVP